MGFGVTSMPLPHFEAGANLSHSSVFFLSNLFLSFLANGEIPGCGQEYPVSSLTNNSQHVCSATVIPLTAPYISRFPQGPFCMTSPNIFYSEMDIHSSEAMVSFAGIQDDVKKRKEENEGERDVSSSLGFPLTCPSLVKIFPDHPSQKSPFQSLSI